MALQEVQQTANPVRLFVLALGIRESLENALRLDPENLEVRLDLVRFHAMTPRIAGGSDEEARVQAAEIARRDAPRGAFARGYLAYRSKEYGTARRELREAVRTATAPSTKALAMKWLVWLSQETQQYDEAFTLLDALRAADPSALYEIGRTAAFCTCRLDTGRAALEQYLTSNRGAGMPTTAEARYQLALLHERRGDLAAARREAARAWQLDRSVTGLRQLRARLRASGR